MIWSQPRACLKNPFRKMCVTICGSFCSDESVVTASYGNRIRAKYTAKWGVQIVGMISQTRSGSVLDLIGSLMIWSHLNLGKCLTWLSILWFKVISTWENAWLDWVFSDLRSSQLRKMLDPIECSLDLRSSVNRCECKEVSEMYRFPRKPVISKSPTHFLLLFAIKSKGLAWFG
mgnify:CR=1 FL=1